MRYEDWDILLFLTTPRREDKVPSKEFKVTCHTVPDLEFSHNIGCHTLPVLTCFVPSLPPGSPFHISIHSWRIPEISHYTQSYSKHVELVKFEARVFVDGRLVTSAAFDRHEEWPQLIENSFEFIKVGQLEPLRFPHFRRELLYQNHWNPSDDIGRIKVVISEGFPRDSPSLPIERVKNIVAFSFQHAPLDILESNGIAWPNPSMWRQPLNSMAVPTFHPDDGADSHSHSPRGRSFLHGHRPKPLSRPLQLPLINTMASPQTGPLLSANTANNALFSHNLPMLNRVGTTTGPTVPDPFLEPIAYMEWMNSFGGGIGVGADMSVAGGWPTGQRNPRKPSSSDSSMPDFASLNARNAHFPEPMHISGPSLDDDGSGGTLKVPTNTPTDGGQSGHLSIVAPFALPEGNSCIPHDLATSLTQSLLNQPLPLPHAAQQSHHIPLPAAEVKSRKENRHLAVAISNPSSASSTPTAGGVGGGGENVVVAETRKFSQPALNLTTNSTLGLAPITTASSCTSSAAAQSQVVSVSLSTTTTNNNSPASQQPTFSGTVSRNVSGAAATAAAAEFGRDITNLAVERVPTPTMRGGGSGIVAAKPAAPGLASASSSGSALGSVNSSSGDKGTKRTRTFTPASARAIDEEDEPRRASPRARIAGAYAGSGAGDAPDERERDMII